MDSNSPSAARHNPLPTQGALLGLDYGTKNLGIAVSNSEQTIAVPVDTLSASNQPRMLKQLLEVIADYRSIGIVIGLPIRTNGEEGTAAANVRQFGRWVANGTKLPVVFVDERYSSAEAELLIWSRGESPSMRKRPLDSLAAKVILQSYLDAPDRFIELTAQP